MTENELLESLENDRVYQSDSAFKAVFHQHALPVFKVVFVVYRINVGGIKDVYILYRYHYHEAEQVWLRTIKAEGSIFDILKYTLNLVT